MAWRAALLAIAACGRIGFDAGLAVVQTSEMLLTTNASTVTFAPTRAGDTLVVATSNIDTTTLLSGIADDANDAFVSANTPFTLAGMVAGEIWYVPSCAAGATTLTIQDSAVIRREIWLLELANSHVLDQGATTSDGAVSAGAPVVAPQVTPSRVPAVIVSIINVDTVSGVSADFVALPELNRDDVAYAIVTAPGSYGPLWSTQAGNVYGAATVAFVAQ
jgi:hypothetical protein